MKLLELDQYGKIVIQCHDNPDADALASGWALYCYFMERGKSVRLIYSGKLKIQKSNLVLMVERLAIPVEYVDPESALGLEEENGLLITVDCQYGAGNVTKLRTPHAAIIDHHQIEITDVSLREIRSGYGSCSTVIWSMMKEAGFSFAGKKQLGTALYYGLFTDTNQFSELHNPVDMDMRDDVECYHNLISLFKNSNLSLKELEIAGIALIRYILNEEHHYAIIKAQPCDPNVLGLISDLVLQVDAILTCVVYNETENGFKLSVRSCDREAHANEVAAFLTKNIGSGGGHIEKAGGFISKRRYMEHYPTLHSEAFFSQRLNEYFEGTEIIYAKDYEIDMKGMKRYQKKKLPLGFVKISEIMTEGTPITIRTLEGDIDISADRDFYLMIGVKGEVYPIKKEKFENSYKELEGKFELEAEYLPTVRHRITGQTESILDFAHSCISTGETQIYGRELDKITKIFTIEEEEKYMLGNPGDFIAARCGDLRDIFIVERDIFFKTYKFI
ncbi:MAG: DHH family phosphoesterase [Lachnospiraceae bacterium]